MIAALPGAGALLLVAAGAAKVADPTRTAGALAAIGWPSSPVLVRLGAAVELALGTTMIVIGGPALAMLVAASFLGFAVFVLIALRSRTPIGTCGCFGRADTPPRPSHIIVVVALAAAATVGAVADAPALAEASWAAWAIAALIAATAYATLTRDGGRTPQLRELR